MLFAKSTPGKAQSDAMVVEEPFDKQTPTQRAIAVSRALLRRRTGSRGSLDIFVPF